MKLYDELIIKTNKLINDYLPKSAMAQAWPLGDEHELIFKNDQAFELGEGSHKGVSAIFYTDDEKLVANDEVLVIGSDLCDIKESTDYARIVLLRVNDEALGTGNQVYANLNKLDYTRYHVFPSGFMMRISTMTSHESVRVAKQAIKNKISFFSVGQTFINAYHKHKACVACKIIFINKKDFPYDELIKLSQSSVNITKALDHLMNNVKMDCNTCGLQVVCKEVEELCNEEFKK